ncbi:DUF3151 domain-containing protein [Microlunatus antarcticus]|uniref:DUF3151 domain-containing protein n=1 Tax=Microlunatus antarcticus TaxID=53388 RepID=A0A7W5JZ36_9ACTN|nr:DUF3151 domain-containing protein [Microlunatus antarcticus]MBB3328996.1 hypothetical protein [Microlunatus antarcticus]
MSDRTRENLMAHGPGTPDTLLPVDPAAAELAGTPDPAQVVAAVRTHPESSLAWALLAERALAQGTDSADVEAYAFARTGYHRGLDALRKSGWRGAGPVPWEHEPNRGFLRALWALSVAAGRFGELVEEERCAQFLRDSSGTAYAALSKH